MDENLTESKDQGKHYITRRQAIKLGGIVAAGLIFSRPIIETIRPRALFANYIPNGNGGNGDTILEECCITRSDKPKAITFQYTGVDCRAGTESDPYLHGQKNPESRCTGDGGFIGTEPVQISYEGSSPEKITLFKAGVEFADIDLGDEFTVAATGSKNLPTEIKLDIIQNGNVLQHLEIHTSCSQPLVIGSQFGSLLVVGCDPEGVIGDCEGGKPISLEFTYTGEGCVANDHEQNRAECRDFVEVGLDRFFVVDVTKPVIIIPIGKSADKIEVVPSDESINIGGNFSIVAKSRRGRKKRRLPANTELEIWQGGALTGTLLQRLKIHTSCSQPLNVDDQFGSLKLLSFNPLAQIASLCDDLGKPQKLTFQYTGDPCKPPNEDDNDQGKKFKCFGSLSLKPDVTIAYTGKHADKVTIVNGGSVATNGEFSVEAPSGEHLPKSIELKITIKDGGESPYQKLEIHTSCSRPLDIGDHFGSLILVEFVSESGAIAPTPMP